METAEQEASDKDTVFEEESAATVQLHNGENTDNCVPGNRHDSSGAANEVGVGKSPDVADDGKHKTGEHEVDVASAQSTCMSSGGSEFNRPATASSRADSGGGAAAASKRRAEMRRCHNAVEHVSSLPLDPPSIIVSGLNVDDEREPCSTNIDEEDDNSGGKGQIWTTSALATTDPAAAGEEQSSVAAYDDNDDGFEESDQSYRVGRELERTGRTGGMLMFCAVLSLPYACVSVWNSLTAGGHSSYNLSLAGAALMTLTAAVIPPLLVWSDRRLYARIQRMWMIATHLRCVCYCNVGRGKSCLHRPRSRRDV